MPLLFTVALGKKIRRKPQRLIPVPRFEKQHEYDAKQHTIHYKYENQRKYCSIARKVALPLSYGKHSQRNVERYGKSQGEHKITEITVAGIKLFNQPVSQYEKERVYRYKIRRKRDYQVRVRYRYAPACFSYLE